MEYPMALGKKALTAAFVLTLLLSASAMLAVNFGQGNIIPWVWHNSGITIRPDGSVEPATASIQISGNVYRLTGDVYMGIAIQRNSTILDGNGFRIYGPYYGTGIVLQNVTDVTVKGLILNYFQNGIYLENSNRSRLEGNVLGDCGIRVTAGSFDTQIVGNNVTGAIVIDFGKDDTISQNLAGSIAVSWSTNITITNNTFASAQRTDTHLNLGNYTEGIYVDNSNNSFIAENVVERKNVGIDIWESVNLNVTGNSLRDNQVGFKLWASDLNRYYRLNIDSTNTVNGRPVYYIVNRTDYEVPTDAGWLAAINSKNIRVQNWNPPSNWDCLLFVNVQNARISNSNLKGGFNGIRFDNVSDSVITQNTLADNGFAGFYFEGAVNCTLTENSVIRNFWFFDIWHGSKSNTLVRNDFIGNQTGAVEQGSENAWDNGVEGNFWSTFTPVDVNGDGISDSPCLITAESGQIDTHPRLSPFKAANVEVWEQQQAMNGPVIAMPREYLNYTLTYREGKPWVAIDGVYPMHLSDEMVGAPLPMVYPTPPDTVNMHVWLDGAELSWSNYRDLDPVAQHYTDIGNWQMIYCPVTPSSNDILMQIHYEHPVQVTNGSYIFLYDLNIAPYLSASSFNSIAHFVVKLPVNTSGIDVYTTGTSGGKWVAKNYTIQTGNESKMLEFDVISEYGKPLWGDIVFVLRDAVPEFPLWIILPIFAAVSIAVLAFRGKDKQLKRNFDSHAHGKN